MEEKVLIQKCRDKQRSAQKYLYDKYSPVLLGICIRYSNTFTEAEDILQEGFIKIFNNINKYSGTGSFEGWLKRIIVNTSITYYHKNLKHKYHHDITEIHEIKIENYQYGQSEFTQDELLNVIKTLPDGYRMVFNLYAIEGYKHKEISEQLGIDINTSKSQYHRARKLIQTKLLDLKKSNYATEQY